MTFLAASHQTVINKECGNVMNEDNKKRALISYEQDVHPRRRRLVQKLNTRLQ